MTMLTREQEAQLVRLAQAGDRSALDRLIRTHRSYMLRVALKITCGDEAAAQDAVQGACLRAIIKIQTFRAEGSIRSWLAQTVVNQALCNHRQTRRLSATSLSDSLSSARATPEVLIMVRSQLNLVKMLLDELHGGVDLEMLLDRAAGVPLKELVGKHPGVDSLPAVKSRIHRARLALQGILDFLPGDD